MSRWIDRLLLIALCLVVTVLTVTALPSLSGATLGGGWLLVHMMASGALVIGMPLFALAFLRHFFGGTSLAPSQQLGYLTTLATGLLTIATVFLCMLPIPSTNQMHELMKVHGWAGFAMVPAVLLLLAGVKATRSASHLHS